MPKMKDDTPKSIEQADRYEERRTFQKALKAYILSTRDYFEKLVTYRDEDVPACLTAWSVLEDVQFLLTKNTNIRCGGIAQALRSADRELTRRWQEIMDCEFVPFHDES